MRIATYNVNGINGRLGNLLGWLDETTPDIVCLQELKAADEKFPAPALRAAGYGAVWHGQKSWNGVAILARGAEPEETRRGLPGDPDDTHSRYIEAVIGGLIVGCLYLPNGNPAPGPKFDYKLRWFERLTSYAQILVESGAPVVLAGDFNVMPTELDVYAPERWVDDALFRPEVRDAYRRLVEQGWTDALRALHPGKRIYTFWKYFRNAFARDAGLRIDHLLLSPALTGRLVAAGVDRDVRAREKSSDHAPVWIELADTGAGPRDGRRASRASSWRGQRSALRGRTTTGTQSTQVVEGKRLRLASGSSCATMSRPIGPPPGVNSLPSAAKHSMAVNLPCWGQLEGRIRRPGIGTHGSSSTACEPGTYEIDIGAQPLGQRCR